MILSSMEDPVRLDGGEGGAVVVRKLAVWRRLEPGDERTPGTEISPESPHLEVKIVKVAVGKTMYADAQRLWKKRDEVNAVASGWTRRYEPAGALFATGGSGMVGVLLDYLPLEVFWLSGSLAILGVAVGAWTRARKTKAEREADAAWRATPERRELEQIDKTLSPRWRRFAKRLHEASGFRTDVFVGDVHDTDRLVSIDLARITHPDTWRPDDKPDEVRYGWLFADGRYVEQVAELEDSDVPEAPPEEEE